MEYLAGALGVMCFVELVGIRVLWNQRNGARDDARKQSIYRKVWEKRARQLGWGDAGFNGLLTDREGAA